MNLKEKIMKKVPGRVLPLLFAVILGTTSCGSATKNNDSDGVVDSDDTMIELELNVETADKATLPEDKLEQFKVFEEKDYNDVLITVSDFLSDDYVSEGVAVVRDEGNDVVDKFKLDGKEHILKDLQFMSNYSINIENSEKYDANVMYYFTMKETLGATDEEKEFREELVNNNNIVLSRVNIVLDRKDVKQANSKGIEVSTFIEEDDYNTLEGVEYVLKDENGKTVEEWVSTECSHHIVTEQLDENGKYFLVVEKIPEGYDIPKKEIEIDLTQVNVGENYGVVEVFSKYEEMEVKKSEYKYNYIEVNNATYSYPLEITCNKTKTLDRSRRNC
jgi:hypothetical protein